jgi:hypothetical protein
MGPLDAQAPRVSLTLFAGERISVEYLLDWVSDRGRSHSDTE